MPPWVTLGALRAALPHLASFQLGGLAVEHSVRGVGHDGTRDFLIRGVAAGQEVGTLPEGVHLVFVHEEAKTMHFLSEIAHGCTQ